MTHKQLSGPAQTRMNDIFAAADLLRRMMSELHSLRAAATSPALAMAIDAHELREQLHELFETVRLLAKAEPRHAEEYLVCEAERDYSKAPPGRDCFGMAN
jgi:hypothetical protein